MQRTPATQLHKSLRSVLLAVQFAGQNLTPTQLRDAAEQAKEEAALKKKKNNTKPTPQKPTVPVINPIPGLPLVQAVPLQMGLNGTQSNPANAVPPIDHKRKRGNEGTKAGSAGTSSKEATPRCNTAQPQSAPTLPPPTPDHHYARGCWEAAHNHDQAQRGGGGGSNDDIHPRMPPPNGGGQWMPVMRAVGGPWPPSYVGYDGPVHSATGPPPYHLWGGPPPPQMWGGPPQQHGGPWPYQDYRGGVTHEQGAYQPPHPQSTLPPTPPRVREGAMIARMRAESDILKINLVEAEYKYMHR